MINDDRKFRITCFTMALAIIALFSVAIVAGLESM